MKLNLPLYSRILLWFMLNVVVLAAAFGMAMRFQFGRGFSTVLGGLVEDRVRVLTETIHNALAASPEEHWDRIMDEFAARNQIHVSLIQGRGHLLAGEMLDPPQEILDEMESQLPDRRRGGPREGHGPPPRPEDRPELDPLFSDQFLDALDAEPPPPRSGPGGPMGRPGPPGEPDARGESPASMPSRLGMFMKSVDSSPHHWVGVQFPPPKMRMAQQGPIVLFFASDSMTGHGLFFDVRPWLYAILGALFVSALLWLPFVRGITHSIRLTMRATEKIAQGRFDVRVPEERGDELGRMAQAVNRMAVQLDGYVRGQKRFLGDIAHELCSPIARMEIGLSILENQLGEAHNERLAGVSTELRDISAMVHELLSFSKVASGMATAPLEAVGLKAIIEDCARTESTDLLTLDVPATLQVMAKPDALRRAIGNILRNAKLHAPGPLHVTSLRRNGHVELAFADEGPGVTEDSLPRLFDPFFRADTSRDRETGGTGLGLAIVKTCVEACEGSVTARNREETGLAIVITLKVATQ